jgi:hypothetical protein
VFPKQDEPGLISVPWTNFVQEGEEPEMHY